MPTSNQPVGDKPADLVRPLASGNTLRPRTVKVGARTVDLPRLARTQRRINWLVLAMYLACGLIPLIITGSRTLTPNLLGISAILLYLPLHVGAIVFAMLLSRRSGAGMFTLVATLVLMCIPLVNAVILLGINQRATKELRRAGVRVGFLGVPAAQMHRLYLGLCRGCGYDLSGLTSATCPECDEPLPARRETSPAHAR